MTQARSTALQTLPGAASSAATPFARKPMRGLDAFLHAADSALRTVFAPAHSQRPHPEAHLPASDTVQPLSDTEKRAVGSLMRVNHVGEVCAQALYTGQALGTRNESLVAHLHAAAREETDHLAWCEQRLQDLGAHRSVLNPLWFAGAFAIGYVAARAGDAWSLGFVVETENQVEAHLQSHLDRLPAHDHATRSIIEQMQADEVAHARSAEASGARSLPAPIQAAMRAASKVMTTVAARI